MSPKSLKTKFLCSRHFNPRLLEFKRLPSDAVPDGYHEDSEPEESSDKENLKFDRSIVEKIYKAPTKHYSQQDQPSTSKMVYEESTAMSTSGDAKRDKWTQEAVNKASKAITTKIMSDFKAEVEICVRRKTLRRYVKANSIVKAKLGQKYTLSEKQNAELSARIVRLAEVGYPITTKILGLGLTKLIEVIVRGNKFTAFYYTPYGHEKGLGHLRIPKDDKAIVAGELAKGVPVSK
ncbi:hypothetical protein JTB14_012400 [Gonioctena quinquepunctata]|nr:hypothetical protein JTB14_012400 [Gonioctena quinquepunctata]